MAGNNSGSSPTRPHPTGNDSQVELTLNDQVVFSETFFSGSPHSANEIIDHGALKATGNELVLASRGAGSFIVADMTVVYKVNV